MKSIELRKGYKKLKVDNLNVLISTGKSEMIKETF
jgi:hypothetical protein